MTESRPTAKLTAASEAMLIVRDEDVERAAAELEVLCDDELRQRAKAVLVDRNGSIEGVLPDYVPDPASMSREDMIELLADEAGGDPPTIAIDADADDPLVNAARELRREMWERNVAQSIEKMGVTGPAAARHRAAAEESELDYLRRLIEETWSLPEPSLRLRAIEIIGKLAGGTEGDKEFPHDPEKLSRGELLWSIATHIGRLALPQLDTTATA